MLKYETRQNLHWEKNSVEHVLNANVVNWSGSRPEAEKLSRRRWKPSRTSLVHDHRAPERTLHQKHDFRLIHSRVSATDVAAAIRAATGSAFREKTLFNLKTILDPDYSFISCTTRRRSRSVEVHRKKRPPAVLLITWSYNPFTYSLELYIFAS